MEMAAICMQEAPMVVESTELQLIDLKVKLGH